MKSPFKSWTLIFNALLILGGLYLPNLSDAVRGILITTGVTNMGLRLKTSQSVSFKRDNDAAK